MLKGIKVRLYPNKTQEIEFNKLLGSYRFVYNRCLSLKKEKYDLDKTNFTLKELGLYFHNTLTKDPDFFWLKEHNTKVLKQSIIDMLFAYDLFFKGKGKVGFPKFKSKHDRFLSCRFPLDAISKRNVYSDNKVTLSSIKNIKFRCSKRYSNLLYENKSCIKSATLTKKPSGKYFLSFLVDSPQTKSKPTSNKSVGIDLGIKTLITLSDGTTIDNPKWLRKQEHVIKKLQRRLSKKKIGSNNRNKARLHLARKHESITNKRNGYLHEITTKLINENQVICMESLNVKGMTKNRMLSKSIQDLGLYELRRQLSYKSIWFGRSLVFVDRWFPSSKLCSSCGAKKKDITLRDRVYSCNNCGHNIDRDLNASINIHTEGIRKIS